MERPPYAPPDGSDGRSIDRVGDRSLPSVAGLLDRTSLDRTSLPLTALLGFALGLAPACSVFTPRTANDAATACGWDDDRAPESGWRGMPAVDPLSQTGSWQP